MRRFRRRRRGGNRRFNRLRLAHRLFDEERFAEAGEAFEELATQAERRNLPRSPQLFLQAGRANIMAGSSEKGFELLVRGLRLMGEHGQHRRLIAVSARILQAAELRANKQQATKLKRMIEQMLQQYGLDLGSPSHAPKQARLPTKCPQCGGTVHPDEVKWFKNHAAECEYCGSILEAQV